MIMTTEAKEVKIALAGTGTATIDWGDGSKNDVTEIGIDYEEFRHTYKSATTHNITVSGNNITGLRCERKELTGLDVSNNTALKNWECDKNVIVTKEK